MGGRLNASICKLSTNLSTAIVDKKIMSLSLLKLHGQDTLHAWFDHRLLRRLSLVCFDSSCRLANLADYFSVHRRRGHYRRTHMDLAAEHGNAERSAAQGSAGIPAKRGKRRYAYTSPEPFSPGTDFCGRFEK